MQLPDDRPLAAKTCELGAKREQVLPHKTGKETHDGYPVRLMERHEHCRFFQKVWREEVILDQVPESLAGRGNGIAHKCCRRASHQVCNDTGRTVAQYA